MLNTALLFLFFINVPKNKLISYFLLPLTMRKREKIMVAKRFELLHLTIPECSQFSLVKIRYLESGALDRSATQPYLLKERSVQTVILLMHNVVLPDSI